MTFHEFFAAKGFTTKSLAAAAGVSHRTLEEYSSGRRYFAASSLKFAASVAGALGIPPEKLIEFDGVKKR